MCIGNDATTITKSIITNLRCCCGSFYVMWLQCAAETMTTMVLVVLLWVTMHELFSRSFLQIANKYSLTHVTSRDLCSCVCVCAACYRRHHRLCQHRCACAVRWPDVGYYFEQWTWFICAHLLALLSHFLRPSQRYSISFPIAPTFFTSLSLCSAWEPQPICFKVSVPFWSYKGNL